MKKVISLFLAIVLLICSHSPTKSSEIASIDSTLADKLEDAAAEYLYDKAHMGISVGIVKDGGVLFLNSGNTKKNGDWITKHTIFEIGSITKTFTATILADLEIQGLISLDDPLGKYLGFPVEFDGTDIKLIDLATHTSGLQRDLSNRPDFDTMLESLRTIQLATKPGEVYEYSNLGFAVLGYVIEKVTGKTYEKVVREYILNKIGMANTVVFLTEKQEALRAIPHSKNGKAVSPRRTHDSWIAVGYLKSTAYDMTQYIMANLGQAAKVSNQLQRAIILAHRRHRTAYNSGGRTYNMGLAWTYGRSIHGTNNPILFQDGVTPGYVSSLVLSHHLNAGIIVLSNHYRESGETGIVNPFELAILLLNVIRDNQ